MKVAEAMELAPPTPACFPARLQWAEYLAECQNDKNPNARPFVGARYRPEFSFCRDCTPEHRTAMVCADKCKPDQFRKDAPVTA